MSYKLVEKVVDDIKAYLSSSMVAKLSSLNTEYGDFELEDIKEYYIAELPAIPEYPVVVILGETTALPDENSSWVKPVHSIMIGCLASDADTERLRRRLYRYIRALFELMQEARSSEDWGHTIVFSRFEYSPLWSRGSDFLSDVRMYIDVGAFEIK